MIKEIDSATGSRLITVNSRHTLRAQLESIVWFFLSLGLAIFIPDILKVMGPLGGLASIYMLTFLGIQNDCAYSVYLKLCISSFQDCVY